jgi:uroporphyrinogen III methyltransferase/synthase
VFARKPDWITFGSSSAVTNLVNAAGPALSKNGLQGVRIASIGPVTSRTVRECGFEVDAEAKPYTMEGLIAAIVAIEKPAAPK